MWRFLKDCCVSWTKSHDELNNLHETLNSLHPDIKFKMDCNNERLPVFDVLVKNTEGKLQTDIYYKPTDSKMYLLFQSCHPNIRK